MLASLVFKQMVSVKIGILKRNKICKLLTSSFCLGALFTIPISFLKLASLVAVMDTIRINFKTSNLATTVRNS